MDGGDATAEEPLSNPVEVDNISDVNVHLEDRKDAADEGKKFISPCGVAVTYITIDSAGEVHSLVPFGDGKGHVAFVTEHGEFAAITTYVKGREFMSLERSGYLPAWYYLETAATGTTPGFGLRTRVKPVSKPSDETIRFINGRWPQITYHTDLSGNVGIDVEMQFLVVEGFIFQECLFRNRSQQETAIPLILDLDVTSRNEDYSGPSSESAAYLDKLGEHGSVRRILPLPEKMDCQLEWEIIPLDEDLACPQEFKKAFVEASDSDDPVQQSDFDSLPQQASYSGPTDGLPLSLEVPADGQRRLLMLYRTKETYVERQGDGDDGTRAERKEETKECSEILHSTVLPLASRVNQMFRHFKAARPASLGFVESVNRRHLHRILDVFSVPIGTGHDDDNHIIAPTDGDGSVFLGHSYWHISFLVTMYGKMKQSASANSKLQRDIVSTCKGYLNWFFDSIKAKPHEWCISGDWTVDAVAKDEADPLGDWDFAERARNGWCILLNLLDFHRVVDGQLEYVVSKLSQSLEAWFPLFVDGLEQLTGLLRFKSHYVFVDWGDLQYRANENLVFPKFQLLDNVLIWWALKTLDEVIDEALDTEALQDLGQRLKRLRDEDRYRLLRPDGYRDRILKTFLPEGSEDAEATFVLYRNAAVDRRSLKARQEFPLLPVFEEFFRQDDSLHAAWVRTLQMQGWGTVARPQNTWSVSARYGLALAMATAGYTLSPTVDSAPEMARTATSVLQKIISKDGNLPGRIDPEKLRRDRGLWYHSYGFLATMHHLSNVSSSANKTPTLEATAGEHRAASAVADNKPAQSAEPHLRDLNPRKHRELIAPESGGDWGKRRKVAQFTFDPKNVVENYPPYQLFGVPYFLLKRPEEITNEEFKQQMEAALYRNKPSAASFREAFIVDICQKKVCRNENRPTQSVSSPITNYDTLKLRLDLERTKENSKKRFCFIERCTRNVADALLKSSYRDVGKEWLSVLGFLERHARCENFLRNHVHKEANLWVTEFHIGYITLDRKNEEAGDGWIGPSQQENFPHHTAGGPLVWTHAAIGYRFTGDAHDRFWTCIVLSQTNYQTDESTWFREDDFLKTQSHDQLRRDTREFQGQRQVLEARLFAKMTDEAYRKTKKVLDELHKALDAAEASTYRFLLPRDDDDQSELEEEGPSWLIQAYLQYSKLLGRLTQNIDGTIHAATQWRDRFNGLEKPRWSAKDERHYRSILNHENRLGQTNIALLEELKAQVNVHRTHLESLKQALMGLLQLKESRESRRSTIEATKQAEDVKLFTYATVVFLPMSFSASLFSMQGSPSDSTIVIFVATTIIALFVTCLVLFNIKTIRQLTHDISNPVFARLRQLMTNQADRDWKEIGKELDHASHANDVRRTIIMNSLERFDSKWWYILFLIYHVSVNIPAGCLRDAYQAARTLARGKVEWLKRVRSLFQILLGAVMLPIFVLGYSFWFIVLNLRDLLIVSWATIFGQQKQAISQGMGSNDDNDYPRAVRKLLPLRVIRLSRRRQQGDGQADDARPRPHTSSPRSSTPASSSGQHSGSSITVSFAPEPSTTV